MLLDPGMIPCGVVGHPVQDDAHAVLVAYFHQILELVDGAKLGGDGLVVADAVGRVLAFLDADGVDGHHPNHVRAQRLNRVDARSDGIERLLGGKYARIHLIHGNVGNVRHLIVVLGLALVLLRVTRGQQHCQQRDQHHHFLHHWFYCL